MDNISKGDFAQMKAPFLNGYQGIVVVVSAPASGSANAVVSVKALPDWLKHGRSFDSRDYPTIGHAARDELAKIRKGVKDPRVQQAIQQARKAAKAAKVV